MDGEFDITPPRARPTRNMPRRQAKIKTPLRPTRSTAAYFSEPSTPESEIFDEAVPDHTILDDTPRRVLRKRKARQNYTSTNNKRRRQGDAQASSKRQCQVLIADEPADPTPPEFIPPWQTMPYHIWLRVFDYVASPLRDPVSRLEDFKRAVSCLLASARVCKTTLEPALANLYKCPPFRSTYFIKAPQSAYVQFCDTLAMPTTETIIPYRPKVKIIRIDVDDFISRKYDGMQMSLKNAIQNLPQLSHVEMYHPLDNPELRRLEDNVRWKIAPDDLLSALEPPPDGNEGLGDKTSPTRLLSWRWNSRLVPEAFALEQLPELHLTPSFSSLRKVAFVNYQLPSLGVSPRIRDSEEMRERDKNEVMQLAASISALPLLEHLILESSTLANGLLLENLPKTLKHLELDNCWEVISEDLENFLVSHGSTLQSLVLKHCQALSLGFLPVLGPSCPHLTHLDVNLKYYRHHDAYPDNKPDYQNLLEEGQVPTWPSSLQSLSIFHMRNWSREAAEMFFGSLVDNARHLPDLRRLEFKVNLNVDWRQRQELRDSLVDKMTRIFKRKSKPPMDLRSLPRPRNPETKVLGGSKSSGIPTRRSTRLADPSSMPNSFEGFSGLSRLSTVNRELRSLKIGTSTFDADDEDSVDELSIDHVDQRQLKRKVAKAKEPRIHTDEFIHGLCDVVDLHLDNQRPREVQYDMEDFLFSEDDSDPEWDGGDVDVFD
ncbi:hypothetical protein GGR56DRAFT_364448 [Xylariaceae sp. FL0804]|nr:hypothetical protein GGR56DRAFT_364448 [Xylariaceae sp. FL0804]